MGIFATRARTLTGYVSLAKDAGRPHSLYRKANSERAAYTEFAVKCNFTPHQVAKTPAQRQP